jgi:glycosyltransferase involved in cell wall biosynthesis
MPKVAIGMPVWNGEKFVSEAEKFVSEAIESILAQTYGDFELVISLMQQGAGVFIQKFVT